VLLWCSTRIYAVCELVGWRLPPLTTWAPWLLAASILFVALLFVGNATTSREYLGRIPRVMWTSNPLAPATFHAAAKLITDLLFSGPRLAVSALDLFRRSVRLSRRDVTVVAEILALLASRDSRISFREICDQVA